MTIAVDMGRKATKTNKQNFKDFCTKLCVCSHKKKIENILNRIFILLQRSCSGMGLWGARGVKTFSVGICDGAPSTARSSMSIAHRTVNYMSMFDLTFLFCLY